MNDKRRPILINGEEYIEPFKKKPTPPGRDKRQTYDEARYKLAENITTVIEEVDLYSQEMILDDFVLKMRLDINCSAKSYHPKKVISRVRAKELGTKKWSQKAIVRGKPTLKTSNEVFIKINKSDLIRFKSNLLKDSGFNEGEKDELRNIDSIYFDNHESLLSKFPEDWEEGRVEFVLHPFSKSNSTVIEKFKEMIGSESKEDTVDIRLYDDGITFASVRITKPQLEKVIKFNPIRTINELRLCDLPKMPVRDLGMQSIVEVPMIKSKINLGIFDGGVNGAHPLFSNYVEEYNPIGTEKHDHYYSHGNGVVSAAVYGDLSEYITNGELKSPTVNVKSYRVLPLSDANDRNLYEVIDIIEDIVPNDLDTHVYNLSIGPYGAIDDDYISRFTYSIDRLSRIHSKLFVTAVGNDGDLPGDLARIQAPSDSVNNLAVGAYSYDEKLNLQRAYYSSVGDGREGSKVKPDVLGFGGCDDYPFHVFTPDHTKMSLTMGTSFASPLIAARAAEIVGRMESATPLLAKNFLIHTAFHPDNTTDKLHGFGYSHLDVDEILTSKYNEVKVIYRGVIQPKKYAVIPLPVIRDLDFNGKVKIKYTIAQTSDVNPLNTEDYTKTAIEDTFIKNQNVFNLTKDLGNKKKQKAVNIIEDAELYEALIEEGYVASSTPATFSDWSNKYKPEYERKGNFKWDTVITRQKNFMYKTLMNPHIRIHAMDRFDSDVDNIEYTVIATIEYLKCEEDINQLTLEQYNKLEAAQVRAYNEVIVNN